VTNPRGPIYNYRPNRKTRALLDQVAVVLATYADHLPLTVRQIFYRLVGIGSIVKTENGYKNLSAHLSNARRGGWVSWDAIRDDGLTMRRPLEFTDLSDYWDNVLALAEQYRRELLAGQPVNVELWCEATGMVPQLEAVAHPWGVPVYSSGGFDSTTVKREVSLRAAADGRDLVLLHVGDYDKWGEDVFTSFREDVEAWALHDGAVVRFVRVAVTPEQIARYNLPTDPRPGKTGNVQAEALDPAVLAELVGEALASVLDLDVLNEVRAASEAERVALVRRVRRLRRDAS